MQEREITNLSLASRASERIGEGKVLGVALVAQQRDGAGVDCDDESDGRVESPVTNGGRTSGERVGSRGDSSARP